MGDQSGKMQKVVPKDSGVCLFTLEDPLQGSEASSMDALLIHRLHFAFAVPFQYLFRS